MPSFTSYLSSRGPADCVKYSLNGKKVAIDIYQSPQDTTPSSSCEVDDIMTGCILELNSELHHYVSITGESDAFVRKTCSDRELDTVLANEAVQQLCRTAGSDSLLLKSEDNQSKMEKWLDDVSQKNPRIKCRLVTKSGRDSDWHLCRPFYRSSLSIEVKKNASKSESDAKAVILLDMVPTVSPSCARLRVSVVDPKVLRTDSMFFDPEKVSKAAKTLASLLQERTKKTLAIETTDMPEEMWASLSLRYEVAKLLNTLDAHDQEISDYFIAVGESE